MIYREAIGNDLYVKVSAGGELISRYPIKIKANSAPVYFSVTGGRGFVPVTFTNLPDFRNKGLFLKQEGEWVEVNQEVHGKDFWQTDYNTDTKTWELTFNINLDSPNDQKRKLEFAYGDPRIKVRNSRK